MMIGRLKFFFFGFFSNRVSREVRKQGYLSMTLSVVLAIVIVFLGIVSGDTVPFSYHYRHAKTFQTMVHNAFANSDEETNIVLEVRNGSISASVVVDTVSDPEDQIKYRTGEGHLIVDTRDTNAMFDDFEAYCLSKDEKPVRVTRNTSVFPRRSKPIMSFGSTIPEMNWFSPKNGSASMPII